jgi:hypothetical protein
MTSRRLARTLEGEGACGRFLSEPVTSTLAYRFVSVHFPIPRLFAFTHSHVVKTWLSDPSIPLASATVVSIDTHDRSMKRFDCRRIIRSARDSSEDLSSERNLEWSAGAGKRYEIDLWSPNDAGGTDRHVDQCCVAQPWCRDRQRVVGLSPDGHAWMSFPAHGTTFVVPCWAVAVAPTSSPTFVGRSGAEPPRAVQVSTS